MASITQRLDVLHDYEAWKQDITLIGVDTSLEAYGGYLVHEENARLLEGVRRELRSAANSDSILERLDELLEGKADD